MFRRAVSFFFLGSGHSLVVILILITSLFCLFYASVMKRVIFHLVTDLYTWKLWFYEYERGHLLTYEWRWRRKRRRRRRRRKRRRRKEKEKVKEEKEEGEEEKVEEKEKDGEERIFVIVIQYFVIVIVSQGQSLSMILSLSPCLLESLFSLRRDIVLLSLLFFSSYCWRDYHHCPFEAWFFLSLISHCWQSHCLYLTVFFVVAQGLDFVFVAGNATYK